MTSPCCYTLGSYRLFCQSYNAIVSHGFILAFSLLTLDAFSEQAQIGSCYVAQAGLEVLASSDPPASASQNARIKGGSHRAQPREICYPTLCSLSASHTTSVTSIDQMVSYGDVHPWNPKPAFQASVLETTGDHTRPLATFSVASKRAAVAAAPNLRTIIIDIRACLDKSSRDKSPLFTPNLLSFWKARAQRTPRRASAMLLQALTNVTNASEDLVQKSSSLNQFKRPCSL
ncbi:hypothetical protein AAY473_021567 [Plecturocebus cupreus]